LQQLLLICTFTLKAPNYMITKYLNVTKICQCFKSVFKKELKHQWIIRHDRATDSVYFGPFKSMTEAETFISKFQNHTTKGYGPGLTLLLNPNLPSEEWWYNPLDKLIKDHSYLFESKSKKPKPYEPSHCSREYCADPDNPDAFYWEDEDSRGLTCGGCHQVISSETYNEDKSIEYYMKEFKN